MSLFTDLAEIVKENEPMSKHTWFRLGGPARYFARPRNQKELAEVVRRCHENSVQMYVLGRGSNILVPDEGINGVVIQIFYKHFGKVSIEGSTVRAEAGASLRA